MSLCKSQCHHRPGYTHMQRAMPTTVAAWLGSFADAFKARSPADDPRGSRSVHERPAKSVCIHGQSRRARSRLYRLRSRRALTHFQCFNFQFLFEIQNICTPSHRFQSYKRKHDVPSTKLYLDRKYIALCCHNAQVNFVALLTNFDEPSWNCTNVIEIVKFS